MDGRGGGSPLFRARPDGRDARRYIVFEGRTGPSTSLRTSSPVPTSFSRAGRVLRLRSGQARPSLHHCLVYGPSAYNELMFARNSPFDLALFSLSMSSSMA